MLKRHMTKVKALTSLKACLPTGKLAPQRNVHSNKYRTAVVFAERLILHPKNLRKDNHQCIYFKYGINKQ